MPLFDDVLVLVSTLLLLLGLIALEMLHSLRENIERSSNQSALLSIIFRYGVIVVASQVMTVLNAALRYIDRFGTYDLRLAVLVVMQSALVLGFIWLVWKIHHLPSDGGA